MKNNNNSGFILAETLIVTTFVAGFLIYILVQLSTLSSSYNMNLKYNTVEGLYALEDILYYYKDNVALMSSVTPTNYIDITSCPSSIVSDSAYCQALMNVENIDRLIVAPNNIESVNFSSLNDEELEKFITTSEPKDFLDYRFIAAFNDGTYATIGW